MNLEAESSIVVSHNLPHPTSNNCFKEWQGTDSLNLILQIHHLTPEMVIRVAGAFSFPSPTGWKGTQIWEHLKLGRLALQNLAYLLSCSQHR